MREEMRLRPRKSEPERLKGAPTSGREVGRTWANMREFELDVKMAVEETTMAIMRRTQHGLQCEYERGTIGTREIRRNPLAIEQMMGATGRGESPKGGE